MRSSQLFFKTFKEAPHEADIVSQQLLERAGYLIKLGKGLYAYSPLMWRVLDKLSKIIQKELNLAGCQEIRTPQIHPASIWQQSGRWEAYTSTHLLYTFQDREGHDYCLAPTHEEVVVQLVNHWVTSYKQLPINLYQISNKFRDEIRPRFGLMRTKEFLMKDGYSFSSSAQEMDNQYQIMRKAYSNIFHQLGLDFVIVQAHGGMIGKDKSEEFQVIAEIGEDAVMVCNDYAVNIEAALATPPNAPYEKELQSKEKIDTPNTPTIESLSKYTKIPPPQILKTLLYKLIFNDREEFVAICIRGDRQINELKVNDTFQAIETVLATQEEIKDLTGSKPGFVGPLDLKIPCFADHSCKPMTNFLCADNTPDIHHKNVNWERDLPLPQMHDFLLAEEGDLCPHIPNGTYHVQRGIEVGHIFNLGTLYSEKLNAQFQDEQGATHPFWMGTYGIGVGRLASACVEQSHDDKGIIWPFNIAPYHIMITAAATKNAEQVALAEKLYQELSQTLEPLYDDREVRLGFKLKDSDLMGIPYKLIIGKSYQESGQLEIESRSGEKTLIKPEELTAWAENLQKTL